MDSALHRSFEIVVKSFQPFLSRRRREWQNRFVSAGFFNEIFVQRLCLKGIDQQGTSPAEDILCSHFPRGPVSGLDPEFKILQSLQLF